MHRLSIHDRETNERFTILANAHCIEDSTMEKEKSSIELSMDNARFRTFTKSKAKENRATILINELPPRYFDSPTIIEFDDEIPLARCSQRTSQNATIDRSFDESELIELFGLTNRKFRFFVNELFGFEQETNFNIDFCSKSSLERINAGH